jgi:hypothetical protein
MFLLRRPIVVIARLDRAIQHFRLVLPDRPVKPGNDSIVRVDLSSPDDPAQT